MTPYSIGNRLSCFMQLSIREEKHVQAQRHTGRRRTSRALDAPLVEQALGAIRTRGVKLAGHRPLQARE